MGKRLRLIAWLGSAAGAALLLTAPVSTAAQLGMAAAAIAVMAAVWAFGRGKLARWAFLATGSLVVLRYIFWRATYTLPPLDQPVNLAIGLVLVAAELYCVLILVISLIINADPLERPALPREDDDALPTVDVFVPTYNEDGYILATTIAAAKAMDYPAHKLTVWLLDDGGTDQKCNDSNPAKAAAARARRASLTKLAEDLGARYLTRAKNEHAKAGNMNNAFAFATGEIVVVFDADHAPFKSFLRETVGHFARDPKLFLVQTPHVFLNPDPIERNLRTFKRMPSENEMFYSVTQRGLDKWNGSFFCGSAALLRREALDVAGGFSGITITEDCETAFELHAKGWNSVFVDKPLIAGLQPETFESFIGQRSRWCQGMFQILLLKNPALKKGLKPIQKLAYLSSMTFWFFPLPRMVFTFAPLLHIFFDVKIFVSSMDEALAYTATYMVVNLMLQNYLYGRVRWPFISELYEYVQGVYLAKAIVSVMWAPRKPSFNVTAKGLSLDEDHISGLAQPFFLIFGILFLSVVTAFYRYLFEPGAELMLIVGLWTSFNLLIAGVALGVVSERREPDRFPRLAVDRRGLLVIDGDGGPDAPKGGPGGGPGGGGPGGGPGGGLPVAIDTVSNGGCSVRWPAGTPLPAGLAVGARCQLRVHPLGQEALSAPLAMDVVRTASVDGGTLVGFAFAPMAPADYAVLADLMYGDPDAMLRFQSARRRHKNLLAGAAQFAWWGVSEPVRALRLAARRAAPAEAPAQSAPAEVAAPAVAEAAAPAMVASPVAIPVAAAVIVRDVVPLAAPTLDADFDALAAELAAGPAAPAAEPADGLAADWLAPLLALAAAEMEAARARPDPGKEPAHVAQSAAA